MTRPEEILDFWFGKNPTEFRKEWFTKNPAFDEEIRKRFSEIHREALDEKLTAWMKTPEHALALVILLDQFPRNMFRGDHRSFASDALGLRYASAAIRKGFDRQVLPVQRSFFYLPFEHSEKMIDQKTSVRLFGNLMREAGMKQTYDYALRHASIIKKFGRFPHRNQILGRKSTAREQEFVAKVPGF